MKSFLHPAIAITTLLFLHLFPLGTTAASSNNYIMDEEGKPLVNGGIYYILPQTTTNGGGLTISSPKNTPSSSCPVFITQEKDANSNGIPIKISSVTPSKYIPFVATNFTVVGVTTDCPEPLAWRVTADDATGEYSVAVGTSQPASYFSVSVPFNYVQPWNYQISYCDEVICGTTGFLKNGVLGINNDIDFSVRFRKASSAAITGFERSSTYVM